MKHYTKYIKYKTKYLNLKELIGGSGQTSKIKLEIVFSSGKMNVYHVDSGSNYIPLYTKISGYFNVQINEINLFNNDEIITPTNIIEKDASLTLVASIKQQTIAAGLFFVAAISSDAKNIVVMNDPRYTFRFTKHTLPSDETYIMISANGQNIEAITSNGNLVSFTVDEDYSKLKTHPEFGCKIKMVSAGIGYNAAITEENKLFIWGESVKNKKIDTDLLNIIYVVAGLQYLVAINNTGTIIYWNLDDNKYETYASEEVFVKVVEIFQEIYGLTLSGKIIYVLKQKNLTSIPYSTYHTDINKDFLSNMSVSMYKIFGITNEGIIKVWESNLEHYDILTGYKFKEISGYNSMYSIAKTIDDRVVCFRTNPSQSGNNNNFYLDTLNDEELTLINAYIV